MLDTTTFNGAFPETKELFSKEIKSLSFPRGTYIFQEGDVNTGIYLIKKGIVKLFIRDNNRRESIFDFHGKGDFLGDRSIFAYEDQHFSAKTITDVEIDFLPKNVLFDSIEQNREVARQIIKNMASDAIRQIRHSQLLAQASLKERVAFCFIYLQKKNTDSNNWTIEVSRDDISNYVGTVKESAVRVMHEFKEKGIIESSGRRITLLKPTELLAIAKISL